jgi:hypothetical protein
LRPHNGQDEVGNFGGAIWRSGLVAHRVILAMLATDQQWLKEEICNLVFLGEKCA